MTPEEIKVAVEGAIPWWFYAIAFIFAFAGSYFGAYAKKRAENRAMKDDFDNLLSQLKKTTKATEKIKEDISRVSWVDQQRWQLKRDLYMELLEALYSEKEAIFKLYDEEKREPPTDPELISLRETFVSNNRDKSLSAIERISKVRGVAGVLLTAESQKALDDLALSWYKSIDGESPEFYSTRLKAADKAYSIVLNAATKDLDVKPATKNCS